MMSKKPTEERLRGAADFLWATVLAMQETTLRERLDGGGKIDVEKEIRKILDDLMGLEDFVSIMKTTNTNFFEVCSCVDCIFHTAYANVTAPQESEKPELSG